MKKLITLFVSVFLITGCLSSLNTENPELTQDEETEYAQLIEESLTKLDSEDITPEEELESLRTIAFSYEYLGEYETAIDYYEQTLALEPEDFAALNNLAAMYEEEEEFSIAAEYIMRLYEANKDQRGVTKDAIRMLTKDGQFDEAQKIVDEFAEANLLPETDFFVTDQTDYIRRMKEKAEGA